MAGDCTENEEPKLPITLSYQDLYDGGEIERVVISRAKGEACVQKANLPEYALYYRDPRDLITRPRPDGSHETFRTNLAVLGNFFGTGKKDDFAVIGHKGYPVENLHMELIVCSADLTHVEHIPITGWDKGDMVYISMEPVHLGEYDKATPGADYTAEDKCRIANRTRTAIHTSAQVEKFLSDDYMVVGANLIACARVVAEEYSGP